MGIGAKLRLRAARSFNYNLTPPSDNCEEAQAVHQKLSEHFNTIHDMRANPLIDMPGDDWFSALNSSFDAHSLYEQLNNLDGQDPAEAARLQQEINDLVALSLSYANGLAEGNYECRYPDARSFHRS